MKNYAIAIGVPWLILLIFVGALYYASSQGAEKAEQRYYFLDEHGASRAEKCEAAQAVSKAYADAEDAKNYEIWSVIAQGDCMNVGSGL